MLKKLLIVCLLISFAAKSQHTINGTMLPVNEELKWVALYQLKGSKQIFIQNVTPEKGKFIFNLPENSPVGMYRLRYKMDNQSIVDFIYNLENIDLTFDPEKPSESVVYNLSKENAMYNSYLQKTTAIKQNLDGIQYSYFKINEEIKQTEAQKIYETALAYYNETQQEFEENSNGFLANHFIKANKKYYASALISSPQVYLNSEKQHFFEFVNFSDDVLNNSSFISELVLNYVFYLNISEDVEMQQILYKNAISEVLNKMNENVQLQSEVITTLLYAFSQNENLEIVDFIVENYYNKLPETYKNNEDITSILESLKLAVGRTAPDFSWDENGVAKSLHNLNTSNVYILVFWSTTCSHCTVEVPQLYEFTKDTKIAVVDVALENDAIEFEKYNQQFENWTNVLGLEKWQNPIARSYDIVSTPTYFILDANKKIIAKPELLEDVKAYFEN